MENIVNGIESPVYYELGRNSYWNESVLREGKADGRVFVFGLTKQLENNPDWIPTVADVKGLLCIMPSIDGPYWSENSKLAHTLPWPQEAMHFEYHKPDRVFEDIGEALIIKSTLLGEISDTGEWNCLSPHFKEMMRRMPVHDRVEVLTTFFNHYEAFSAAMGDPFTYYVGIWNAVRDMVPLPESSEVSDSLTSLWLRTFSDIDSFRESWDGNTADDPWIIAFESISLHPYLVFGLGNPEIADEKRMEITSMMMRVTNVASTLNAYREAINSSVGENHNRKPGLESELRQMLGILDPTLRAHTNLESVYQNVDFGDYHLNEVTAETRLSHLDEALFRMNVQSTDRVMSLGCGTGWVAAKLQEWGFDNIMGLDYSPTNLAVARRNNPTIRFLKGSWYEQLPGGKHFDELMKDTTVDSVSPPPPLPNKKEYYKHVDMWNRNDSSEAEAQYEGDYQEVVTKQRGLKAIEITGWSLHHAEERHLFEKVIENCSWVQEKGDMVVADFHDPAKGRMAEGVDRYRAVLKAYHFSDEELEKTWYVVDGPAGEDGTTSEFYNRFVPPIEWVILNWRDEGYVLAQRFDDVEPTGKGDVSTTLVLEKVDKSWVSKLLKPHFMLDEERIIRQSVGKL